MFQKLIEYLEKLFKKLLGVREEGLEKRLSKDSKEDNNQSKGVVMTEVREFVKKNDMWVDFDPKDISDEIKVRLEITRSKVNLLLAEAPEELTKLVIVQRGWRSPEKNTSVGGVLNSPHESGEGIDIRELKFSKQELAKWCAKNQNLLKKHGLYLEDPAVTVGNFTDWCHLQTRPTKLGNVVFMPYSYTGYNSSKESVSQKWWSDLGVKRPF